LQKCNLFKFEIQLSELNYPQFKSDRMKNNKHRLLIF